MAQKMNFQKRVFAETISMETQTVYHKDGRINTFPCDFELGQEIIPAGRSLVCQRGTMRTDDDGRSHFTPFRVDTGRRYVDLFTTPCGVLQSTKKGLRVKICLKKKLSRKLLLEQLDRDYKAIRSFIRMTR